MDKGTDIREVAQRLAVKCRNLLDEEQMALLIHMLMMRDFTPPTLKGRMFLTNIIGQLNGKVDEDDIMFLKSYFSL